MTSEIPAVLRAQVRERAKRFCEYCQSSEFVCGHYFEVDHIIPHSKGGATESENLALACRTCNAHKAGTVDGFDAQAGKRVLLFNPRTQRWKDNFSWDRDGRVIQPLTDVGRVTVDALNLNDELSVGARVIWVTAQLHPPSID